MARLATRYREEIVPQLTKTLGVPNPMAVPRLKKITVNMGVGSAIDDKKSMDEAVRDLTAITGQKPLVTRARVSVSAFRLRQGMPVGCKVTLRGPRMYEFLDRLVSLAIPRIRDFRGLNPGSFDGRGNFSLGVAEKTIFPEIEIDNVEYLRQGMDVTLSMTGGSDERSLALLRAFGMPFRQ